MSMFDICAKFWGDLLCIFLLGKLIFWGISLKWFESPKVLRFKPQVWRHIDDDRSRTNPKFPRHRDSRLFKRLKNLLGNSRERQAVFFPLSPWEIIGFFIFGAPLQITSLWVKRCLRCLSVYHLPPGVSLFSKKFLSIAQIQSDKCEECAQKLHDPANGVNIVIGSLAIH